MQSLLNKKIIFFGTPKIAIPSLNKISANVIAVVTQPDKPQGRGQKVSSSPIKELALSLNISVLQPESTLDKDFRQKLRDLLPDLMVVVAYGKILGKKILEIPRLSAINLHPSLLPKYRGASPINWAIYNGEKTTGITIQKITSQMDAGPILGQKEVEILDNENAIQLEERLASIGAELLYDVIENIENITPIPQDDSKATFAPILKKEDGLIDWNKDASFILRQILSLVPWPAAYTLFKGEIFKIYSAQTAYEDLIKNVDTLNNGEGTIIGRKDLIVKCGNNSALLLKQVQQSGKKMMNIASFINGARLTGKIKLGSDK